MMNEQKELNAPEEKGSIISKMIPELREDELDQISGGVLTAEAQLWWNRNENEILNRTYRDKAAFHALACALPPLISPDSANIVTLDELKKEVGKFVDLNGLV